MTTSTYDTFRVIQRSKCSSGVLSTSSVIHCSAYAATDFHVTIHSRAVKKFSFFILFYFLSVIS